MCKSVIWGYSHTKKIYEQLWLYYDSPRRADYGYIGHSALIMIIMFLDVNEFLLYFRIVKETKNNSVKFFNDVQNWQSLGIIPIKSCSLLKRTHKTMILLCCKIGEIASICLDMHLRNCCSEFKIRQYQTTALKI